VWRRRPPAERAILFAAVLLHDVGKATCTRVEPDGHISSHGHAVRGETAARGILWKLGVPIWEREQIAALIRFHQKPFYLFDQADPRRLVLQISQSARCDHLALLAEADSRGRICHDGDRLSENVALFVEFCREQGCLSRPYPSPSGHSRFQYFRTEGRDPDYRAHDDARCEVVVMSGLPGAGKDHWIEQHLPTWPVVSLDVLRGQLGVAPTEHQGVVVAAAYEQSRQHLRRGESFIWNATNLSRSLRQGLIRFLADRPDRRARIRIIYVEASRSRLLQQNRRRPDPVPEAAFDKLLARWQVPDQTEAHQVDWALDATADARTTRP